MRGIFGCWIRIGMGCVLDLVRVPGGRGKGEGGRGKGEGERGKGNGFLWMLH